MKVIVVPTDSGIPRLQIKPESPADEAVLNAIVRHEDAPADMPDVDFCLIATEVNGDSYASITIGINED